MPEEHGSSATKHGDHKVWSRHRWREKLSRSESSTSKDPGVRDQDIQSFLHGSTGAQVAPAVPTLRLPVNTRPSDEHEDFLEIALLQVKRKQPRRPGLRVTFASTAPVIIGEGGDEALLPAIEVLTSLQLSEEPHVVPLRQADHEDSGTAGPVGSRNQEQEVGSSRPRPLERRSTGLRDHDGSAGNPQQDSELGGWCRDLSPRSVSPVSPISSPGDDPLEESSNSELRFSAESSNPKDELHRTYVENRVDNVGKEGAIEYRPKMIRDRQQSLNPATSLANSLTPSPSPYTLGEESVSLGKSYPFPTAAPFKDRPLVATKLKPSEQTKQQQRPQMTTKISSDSRGLSLRNVAKSFGEDALHEFATRVRPFGNLFLLGLSAQKDPTLWQWVMAASWWFLRGRSTLEAAVRSKPPNATVHEPNTIEMTQQMKQAYVDLAKAWWVVFEMIPQRCPEVKQLEYKGPAPAAAVIQRFFDAKNAEPIQIHLSITSNLRALCMSMKKNGRMPPHDLELQGLDARVFLEYPVLSPSAARLLSLENSGPVTDEHHIEWTSFFPFPVTDTESHFNYGRMFVEVVVGQVKAEGQLRIPCLLSILRHRRDRDITLVVASQDSQVHLVIQPDVTQALSWQDVHWDIQKRSMDVNLRADFNMQIRVAEGDFKTLWGIHDHTRAVQKASQSTKTDLLAFEDVLPSCQWFEQGTTATLFPAEPVEGCTLRLFECFTVLKESLGERKVHNGFRLVLVTPRNIKKLSCVSLHLGKQTPIVFSYLRDGQGAPAMLLKTSKSSRDPYMVIGFHEPAKRDELFSILSGTAVASNEHSSIQLSLAAYSVDPDAADPSTDHGGALGGFNARGLKVFRPRSQANQRGGHNLRLWIEEDTGCVIDRINLGPGELQLRLNVTLMNRIYVSRPPQQDMTLCFADDSLNREQYEHLRRLLSDINQSPSTKTFDFLSLNDLHTFQALITGFTILFDGFAKSFNIPRRRMVAIHKRWEASTTRIQIIKHEQTVQLLAFFKDFSHGKCMNFVIKSTERFESFSRSGVPYLCIVDAKFALPKGESGFVCLDMPEYPGEHDDISIGFESEYDRDTFAKALPATVTQLSRLESLRR
ncbi:MAG: hypothetical protein Q9218_002828 [Villophora microphyllina]